MLSHKEILTIKKAEAIIIIALKAMERNGEWEETASELREMSEKYARVLGVIKEASKAPTKEELEALRKEGLSLEKIANRLKSSRSSVANWLRAYDLVKKGK